MTQVRYLESVKYQEGGVMFDFVAGQAYEVSASTLDHVARGIAVEIEDDPVPEVAADSTEIPAA